ncbi:uncharacterized protein LOC126378720 [Pectinophora gossypiella]|uniref:uncharacterized protein LOC126378720 n=1 Tax=Pectinophora gossypiella TaxID=13191 RepID=UPI00214ECEF2|nr:uncharacterized protein LOC126378720 [Pectinophora gossypiella]
MLGIDTMSRARAYNSLPKTVKYLQSYDWLDFRAYSKVGFRTFENILPLLTGLPPITTRVLEEQFKALEKNAHRFMWNRFKEAGYMTAFGETHMETFFRFYELHPTDHYVRRFEEELWRGNYVCSGSMFPERHLFDYILQFIRAYKDPYFGFFFSNSFSHDYPGSPALLDKHLIEFLEQLRQTKSWNSTFVVLFSDHGVTYGKPRNDKQKEFYYEERLPMLFMQVPDDFKEVFPDEYFNMQWNQNRLTTVYDLHATMLKILSLSTNTRQSKPDACPKVTGLTEKISSKRTCKDACVSEIYCTCQCLINAPNTWLTRKSLNVAVSKVQQISQAIKTDVKCTKCAKLKYEKTNRIHFYTRGNKTWYIVNFDVSPGYKSFEAILEYDGQRFTHLVTEITKAMADQSCVYAYQDKVYCECIKDNKCT